MIKGFLFTLGVLFAIFFFFFILIMVRKLTKKKANAPVKAWKKYLEEVIHSEDFRESIFVTELISGKQDEDNVKTPEGYKVVMKPDLVIDEHQGEGSSSVRLKKTYKIIKLNN